MGTREYVSHSITGCGFGTGNLRNGNRGQRWLIIPIAVCDMRPVNMWEPSGSIR